MTAQFEWKPCSSQVVALLANVAAVVAAYLVWLGWHAEYEVDPDALEESGPYTASQVLGLVMSLLVIVVLFTLILPAVNVTLATTASLTLTWCADAVTVPDSDGLFVVGGFMLAVVAILGLGAVALATSCLTSRIRGLNKSTSS